MKEKNNEGTSANYERVGQEEKWAVHWYSPRGLIS